MNTSPEDPQTGQTANPKPDTWKPAFLAALERTGSIAAACEEAHVSRYAVQTAKAGDKAFAECCASARQALYEDLEEAALRRARDGVQVPVFYRGEKKAEFTRFNDTLLMYLLKTRRERETSAASERGDIPASFSPRSSVEPTPAQNRFDHLTDTQMMALLREMAQPNEPDENEAAELNAGDPGEIESSSPNHEPLADAAPRPETAPAAASRVSQEGSTAPGENVAQTENPPKIADPIDVPPMLAGHNWFPLCVLKLRHSPKRPLDPVSAMRNQKLRGITIANAMNNKRDCEPYYALLRRK